MNPGILFMLTMERRFEIRRRVDMPRRSQPKGVKRTLQLRRSDLINRILGSIRRPPSCECS